MISKEKREIIDFITSTPLGMPISREIVEHFFGESYARVFDTMLARNKGGLK